MHCVVTIVVGYLLRYFIGEVPWSSASLIHIQIKGLDSLCVRMSATNCVMGESMSTTRNGVDSVLTIHSSFTKRFLETF